MRTRLIALACAAMVLGGCDKIQETAASIGIGKKTPKQMLAGRWETGSQTETIENGVTMSIDNMEVTYFADGTSVTTGSIKFNLANRSETPAYRFTGDATWTLDGNLVKENLTKIETHYVPTGNAELDAAFSSPEAIGQFEKARRESASSVTKITFDADGNGFLAEPQGDTASARFRRKS